MKSLRQKKFGVCCYCGQKTKFYKRSHKECHNKFMLGNNKILSLKDAPSIWADAIIDSKNNKILSTKEQIKKAGYDIKIEAKKLEKIYKEIVSKGRKS